MPLKQPKNTKRAKTKELFNDFYDSLTKKERASLATRCGTTAGTLKNARYSQRPIKARLAVAIDRETKGAVSMFGLAPHDLDWAYVKRTVIANHLKNNGDKNG